MNNDTLWSRLNHLDSFDETATQTAFLLGGIGTGNISLGSRGEMKDWELFNSPGKGNVFPYTFFALHVNNGKDNDERVCHNRVLEGPIQPPHNLSHGYDSARLAGLPRFEHSQMRAEYPLSTVRLKDNRIPVNVTMEAYTPFIPLDDEDSALPVAVLRYRIKNPTKQRWFVSVAGSLANMTSFDGYGTFGYVNFASETRNKKVTENGLQGFLCEALPTDDGTAIHNTMALTTPNPQASVKPAWYLGAWYDGAQDFWDDFSSDGLLREEGGEAQIDEPIMFQRRQRIGSVAPYQWLEPGEEAVFTFYLTWHIPHRIRSWWQENGPDGKPKPQIRNYYSLRFDNAFSVAAYTHEHLPRLEQLTYAFHDALFSSTLPKAVLDAVSANITVLRSTTCFRIEDGSFFGWEGCFNGCGCCDGTCTHVWNYAQTLAFLFPKLEQSMRRDDFLVETKCDGSMNFRSRTKLQDEEWGMPPALDGQCGSIIRLHREWLISRDDSLIADMGESALKALDFAMEYWDADSDGVPDSRQHNTYDIEFYGPNPLSAGMLLAALKAGESIATQLGQQARAQTYAARFAQGSARTDELLWNGEYYVQRLDDVNQYPYQHGEGCLSDQLFGQFLAHVAGLGYILPQDHVKQALQSIYRYNFLNDLSEHESVQRCYALGHERGLVLCSWPKGGRPRFPFVYSTEVWTGIEYQVAAALIYEGCVDEGLDIVRAVRERQDGYKRSPFNEVECGHHYARSMASWALIPALSGFTCDRSTGQMNLDPKLEAENFSCFYSTGKSWGVAKRYKDAKGAIVQEFTAIYDAE